ncbi:MAG: transcriptional regulator [Firmicutes bacterium GWF2_51_9]|nr:MAG: transcriptional regulator [Firmicutes bacterium GWF2_51_9]OGS59726.1 MAG: transcriptional regulator [Firmicutes bacterium GWE2_51_13]HAM63027.1 transcriptional regulator [Erysipelotrichaceae bacterium]HBZ42203.1 transcriptional regulator [Erysipelotrichaceae bacterium]
MMRMDDFRNDIQRWLKDEEFRKEYESLETEYSIIQAIIDARKNEGLTQKRLSMLTGVTQADISKLERGIGNPSLKTLQRIADGLGMKLKLILEPKSLTPTKP